MTDSHQNETAYKKLAENYVRTEGTRLSAERRGAPLYLTPRLDGRVHRRTTEKKRVPAYIAAAMAACILLALFIPSVFKAPPVNPAQPTAALIPLNFTLPANFTVAEKQLDQGTSVYYLADARKDDVVLMLERSAAAPSGADLTKIELNGKTAYARAAGEYNLLTFRTGGILYTLSCRYELNTLIAIGENIL